jgi:hypothetical protein
MRSGIAKRSSTPRTTNEYVLGILAIVATTLHLAAKTASPVSLLSCDHVIIASGLVPIIW